AAGHGHRQPRTAEFALQEPETLGAACLLELTPLDPVLAIGLLPLAGLPGAERREAPIPQERERGARLPRGLLQTESRAALERLRRRDRLLDPARPLAEPDLDVDEQALAQLLRRRREATAGRTAEVS